MSIGKEIEQLALQKEAKEMGKAGGGVAWGDVERTKYRLRLLNYAFEAPLIAFFESKLNVADGWELFDCRWWSDPVLINEDERRGWEHVKKIYRSTAFRDANPDIAVIKSGPNAGLCRLPTQLGAAVDHIAAPGPRLQAVKGEKKGEDKRKAGKEQ